MTDVVIVSAARTPIGAFNGALSSLPAHALGKVAISAALERAKVEAGEVDEVVLGQILSAGEGQNPARQAAMAAGIPQEKTAYGINQLCGSGLRAVALGYQAIKAGDSRIVVAGGQESMTRAPHAAYLRAGVRMGPAEFVDTMIRDGLWDIFNGYHMGITAENVAEQYQVTRADQDAFAVASQNKAEAAIKSGRFMDEIVSVTVPGGKAGDKIIDTDEYPRFGATIEAMEKLKSAFKKDGTVTAANASGINDGAAALVLMSDDDAARRNIVPLVRIASWAHVGLDPAFMGLGPIAASQRALERAGWSTGHIDLWEINEAFAAQSLAVIHRLGIDPDRVNVNGGAVALGHPIGASGARVLTTLIHELKRRRARRGLATLCIGGGMGIALCIEGLWS
jgi:acetyl-CoA C-acetyltransferase